MKYLKPVQIIYKVLHILSQIAFVCCIIGVVCCVIGGAAVLALPDLIDDPAFTAELYEETGVEDIRSLGWVVIASATAVAFGAVSVYFTKAYLKHELILGTPFDHQSAKELFRAGLVAIIAPVVSSVVMMIFVSVLGIKGDVSVSVDITGGVAMLLLSYLMHYGADIRNKSEEM